MAVSEKLRLEIVTPERRVETRDVDEVILPGADGLFGVLPGHAPLLAGLGPGLATVRVGTQSETLVISGGFAEVGPDHVTVLAETCETSAEVDRARAEAKLRELERRLTSEIPADEEAALQDAFAKHRARIAATERAPH